jgi:hypothetical protein
MCGGARVEGEGVETVDYEECFCDSCQLDSNILKCPELRELWIR